MKITKIYYILGLVTMLLAGCTGVDNALTTEPSDMQHGDTPLSFDVAEVVEAHTRGGSAGNVDYGVLSKSDYGFGVVAGAPLNWTNQKVTYSESVGTGNPGSAFLYPSKWQYAGDMKYWVKDIRGAAVNFYAYAPYVESPSGTEGITGISGNNVTYAISTDITNGVDLLWGVNGETGLPWNNTTYTDKTGTNLPTGGPVLFTFRHALAAIGFRAQTMINKDNVLTDFEDESAIAGVLRSGGNYKVTIKKIELIGDFHLDGILSLNNSSANTPLWDSKSTATPQTLTVHYDQIMESMRHPHDNLESTETGAIGTNDTDGNTANDSDAKKVYDAAGDGVTQEAQQQVVVNDANGKERCFFVIPREARNYTLKLYWCVSAKLPNETTYIAEDHENTIPISDLELKAGTKYLLTFVIGLKLIGLTVTATDWLIAEENAEVIIEHGTSANQSLAK